MWEEVERKSCCSTIIYDLDFEVRYYRCITKVLI